MIFEPKIYFELSYKELRFMKAILPIKAIYRQGQLFY